MATSAAGIATAVPSCSMDQPTLRVEPRTATVHHVQNHVLDPAVFLRGVAA